MPQRVVRAKNGISRPSRVLIGAVLILAAAGLTAYFWLDSWAVARLSRIREYLGIGPWAGLASRLGKAWLQIWLLLVWFWVSRRRREVHAALVALVLVAVTVCPLKYAVGRPRPYAALENPAAGQAGQDFRDRLSFPSGDTAAAFAVATAVLPAFGWPARLLLLICCATIGGLRVAAGSHYPSDVLAGAAIGVLAGWLAAWLVARWGRSDRPVPLEDWLVFAGLIGIPAAVVVLRGPAESLPALRTYGSLVLGFLLAARIVDALSFAKRRSPS